ncbi:MAG: hypothetical protein SCALA702_15390 [Melioribacteraceae bacterium]|nr:MAG: hypothetical protein SCALA702_15390 [Melioribacteraceae bacterium]
MEKKKKVNPWAWVPSLYFAEGIPYVIVMTVSVIMYKRLGISNTDIALYTSWLYLPWVIKPLWSPIVDLLKTKRFWIVIMQLFVGAGLGGVALTIPVPGFFQFTLLFFWLLAFSSATHDIAADGFYMLGLNKHDQAFFVGIRSTFYRGAMITGQGILIVLAGFLESSTGLDPIDLQVSSNPNVGKVEYMLPDSAFFANHGSEFETLDGELRIIKSTDNLEVATVEISNEDSATLISTIKDWNISNNFYEAEKTVEEKASEAGWWSNNISDPLGKVIHNMFGPEEIKKAVSATTGNLGVIYFHLSQQPPANDNVVLNFGWENGDKSIALVEGTRFTFTSENWNKPAFAVVQLDKKLKTVSTAGFVGRAGNIPLAWVITFAILAGMFFVFFIYHKFMLPYPESDVPNKKGDSIFGEFFKTFAAFFKKEKMGVAIFFLLVYRLGESQLVKLASPFLLDPREAGGLGLTTGEVGFIYGTFGILALTIGGILGGILAARQGLKYWMWWMVLAMNLPNTVYVYLSYAVPESQVLVTLAVMVEQFGYGFGFTAYMLFMIYISEGEYKTAHYAITTAFMALGMMIPGMISGWLQELIGYQHFFIWVLIATVPAFLATKMIKIDPEFGKKNE